MWCFIKIIFQVIRFVEVYITFFISQIVSYLIFVWSTFYEFITCFYSIFYFYFLSNFSFLRESDVMLCSFCFFFPLQWKNYIIFIDYWFPCYSLYLSEPTDFVLNFHKTFEMCCELVNCSVHFLSGFSSCLTIQNILKNRNHNFFFALGSVLLL